MKKKILVMLLAVTMLLTLVPVPAAVADDGAPLGDFFESAGVRFEEEFKMVFVEGGTFTLGWEPGTPGEPPEDTLPVPGVKVSDYWISDTVVTNGLWAAVMGTTAPAAATRNTPRTAGHWYDVQEFFARLYVLTGKVYYMPTEAQWEYAAKGGKPGYAAGHNLYPYPGSLIASEVVATSGAVRSRNPNILGIYDMSGREEWAYNAWNTAHIGGEDPIGIGGPIHSQKTRRGGRSSTMLYEYHSRLIRSIDGTGPAFRIALSADMESVPPGMVKPSDIHAPRLDDRDTPNSYRDPRWVTGDSMVWEGHYQGYGGGAMKVWATGEIVLRPHNFNGYDPGDIVGQWYSFNNYGMVIIPNADSPNPDKNRMLIPYMFLDQFTVSTINDRKNASTAGPTVVWPDIYMAPTGRLVLQDEANLKATIEANRPAAPNPPEQFGQNYMSFPYFGGTYELIQKPVVPGLVATGDLAAGVGIVAANHQLWEINGLGSANSVFPTEARSQDIRLVDGPDRGWWMGYGFGGIHTYRKDIDLGGNFRHSVYSANPGTNITPQQGGLARGPWFTVNDMFVRVQGNAAATQWLDYLYLIVPDMEGNVLNTNNFPMRHLSYMSYERGDSRIFHLRNNEDVERHPYEQGGTTGYGAGFGQTTWRIAAAARRACPGIPTGPGINDFVTCGLNVMTCTCPIYCRVCESHVCAHVEISLTGDTNVIAGDTVNYKVSFTGTTDINALQFILEVDGAALKGLTMQGAGGFVSVGGFNWYPAGGDLWRTNIILLGAVSSGGDVLTMTFETLVPEGVTTVKIIDVKAASGAGWAAHKVVSSSVVTTIGKWFSIYDVNKDGVIDLLDLALAQTFFMAEEGDANWDQAKVADVNGDGRVDIADLILIRANFTVPF